MKDLSMLHPWIRAKCKKMIEMARARGLRIIITQTWRSKAYQTQLWNQGRSLPGKIVTNCKYPYSPHCWGLAFDVAIVNADGKTLCWSDLADTDKDGINDWTELRDIGVSLGLEWGGDWKRFVDKPHFEDPNLVINNKVTNLITVFGTPERFMKTWKEVIEEDENMMHPIKIKLNGKELQGCIVDDNGVSYIPTRAVSTAIGAQVSWDDPSKTVTLTTGGKQ